MNLSDDYIPIPISALQHYAYCPRQCALIHIERAFADNAHTARGQAVHQLVDKPGYEVTGCVRVERSLPVWSDQLGLIGSADLVEFHPDGSVYPVEFKHGRRRPRLHDDIQLAAQAICLEEMLGRPVLRGAIYHALSRRRREVRITTELRSAMLSAVSAVRTLLEGGTLPRPANDERCRECSLKEICQPEALAHLDRQDRLKRELLHPE